MSAVTRRRTAQDAGREVTRRDGDETDWGALVERLLGPTVTPADRERRRADALALARAALKAAGENQEAARFAP